MAPDAVRKRYLTEDAKQRAVHEARALKFLEKKFGRITAEGWTYKTARLLRAEPDREAIVLEYATGTVLADLPVRSMPDAAFHTGLWVGLYQQRVMNKSDEGLPYTDCSMYNMSVDFDTRTFTVFDPGKAWGRPGWIYEDLASFVISILSVCTRRRLSPFKLLHQFFRGYASVADNQFRLLQYYRGVMRQIGRKDRAVRDARMRWPYRIGTLFMAPVYFIYLPLYLQVKHLAHQLRQGPP